MNTVAGETRPEKNCAPKLASYTSSLSSWNCCCAWARCPNVLTMVKPLYVSSMWALSRPVLAHWATNRRWERRAITRVAHNDNGTVTTVSSVSSGEMVSIITSTATTVSTEVSSWLMVIDSDVWMLSTSLVTLLSTSPRWRESK